MKIKVLITIQILICLCSIRAQNSLVGDGFGGRLWYSPTNYTVGSYTGYSVCGENSQLLGWGSNNHNQLGIGSMIPGVDAPIVIPEMDNVKYYSCGYEMGAIKNDNTGWIWGETNPIQVIEDAFFVDAGILNVSFVKNDGTVWTSGQNYFGIFGTGTIGFFGEYYIEPTQMNDVSTAVRVAINRQSSTVLLADSTLLSCGDNTQGNLGLGNSVVQSLTPQEIGGLPKIIDVKSHSLATIALSADGDVYTWGIDLGNMNHSPVLVPTLENIVAISGCDDGIHFLALDANKDCYGWGLFPNTFGLSMSSDNGIPHFIASDVIDIMAGETFSYIVKTDGSLWASGYSNDHSIWLDLPPETQTQEFVRLDPSKIPELCLVIGENIQTFDDLTMINVFTPNNDGVNDEFHFPTEGLEHMNWKIYDRWGVLIFETNNIKGAWNGNTINGSECSEGQYFYTVRYKYYYQELKNTHGSVALIR